MTEEVCDDMLSGLELNACVSFEATDSPWSAHVLSERLLQMIDIVAVTASSRVW